MMNNNVLIVGNLSFLGKNLAIKLYNEKYNVSVMDYKFESIKGIKGINSFICEPNDLKTIRRILNEYTFDCIIYMNSYIKYHNAQERANDIYERNIINLNNFMNIMKDTKNKNIIFVSHYFVYGKITHPVKETDDLHKSNHPCGISMKAAESILYTYSNDYNIKTTILRTFPFYGTYSSDELIIQYLINKISNNEPAIITTNPNKARQYLYIDDFTEAISLILKNKELKPYSVFNIASNETLNVYDIVKTIEEITNKKANITYSYNKTVKVKTLQANTDKIKKILKFKPQTTFKENIKYMLSHMGIV